MIRSPIRRCALVALLSLAAGCSKSTSPSTPSIPVGTQADLLRAINAAYVSGAVLPTTIDPAAGILATMDVSGLRAAAALFVVNGTFADVGEVDTSVPATYGGGNAWLALDQTKVNVLGHVQSIYSTLPSHPAGINLVFDGTTNHQFRASGSSTFPATTDGLQSVAMITLSAPANGANVPRTSDLVVSWSNAGADTTVYVQCIVTSLVDSTQQALATLVRDPAGSTSVPTASLGTLPAGAARLAAARYRMVHRTYTGGVVAQLICEAVALRSLTLQ